MWGGEGGGGGVGRVATPHFRWSGVVVGCKFSNFEWNLQYFKESSPNFTLQKIKFQDIEHNSLFLDKYMYRFTDTLVTYVTFILAGLAALIWAAFPS